MSELQQVQWGRRPDVQNPLHFRQVKSGYYQLKSRRGDSHIARGFNPGCRIVIYFPAEQ